MKAARSCPGFTLLEILVAVSITLLLAGVMLSVTTATLSVWRRTQDAFTAETQAKLVLDYLERDLQAALFRPDGGTWLAADVINDAGVLIHHGWLSGGTIKPSSGASVRYLPPAASGLSPRIADARFGLSGVWLRFITTNIETSGSLPVAVSYQIARRPVAGPVTSDNRSPVRYTLFRSAVSPENTFAAGYDVLAGYAYSGVTPPAQRTTGVLTNPNTAGDAIATHVVDFGVWLHVWNAAGDLRRIHPESAGDASHAASSVNAFPSVVDVLVRILSEEGANQIERMESGDQSIVRPAGFATDAEWWWAVVEANSRVFTRRIEVKGQSR